MHDDAMKKLELLSEYVTHGKMDADDMFDGHFRNLMEMQPERSSAPLRLWRVLVLPQDVVERMRAGEEIALRPRAFGSWTRSKDAIAPLLRKRAQSMSHQDVAIVIEKVIPSGTWMLDVERSYRDHGWTHPDFTEWQQYVVWECEVLVAQDPEMLTIGADDVVSFHEASSAFGVPVAGETCWLPDFVGRPKIVSVPADQPEAAEGIYAVETDEGTGRVRWNGTECCWDPVEEIEQIKDLGPPAFAG